MLFVRLGDRDCFVFAMMLSKKIFAFEICAKLAPRNTLIMASLDPNYFRKIVKISVVYASDFVDHCLLYLFRLAVHFEDVHGCCSDDI